MKITTQFKLPKHLPEDYPKKEDAKRGISKELVNYVSNNNLLDVQEEEDAYNFIYTAKVNLITEEKMKSIQEKLSILKQYAPRFFEGKDLISEIEKDLTEFMFKCASIRRKNHEKYHD